MLKLFGSIRPLQRTSVRRNVIAGCTLAAMNIPQVLGYTKIAGMPLVTGLYTLLLPLVAFAAFGSSRFLVVSADSATAAILAGSLVDFAPLASGRYVALAGAVALLTAIFLLLATVLKLGFLADFLSQTVLTGFLTGVGFQVGIAVLGSTLGIQVSSHRTVLQLAQILHRLPGTNLPTFALSAGLLAILLLLRRIAPSFPGPLFAVAGSIAASALWSFQEHGIQVIGSLPGGLPHFGLPAVHWSDLPPLLPVAAACCVIIITQSAATARAYAGRHQQQVDENADFAGLSAANAVAALSGAFVVNGSPTQTAMVESAGGGSQLAQLSTAAVAALVLLFFVHPLEFLPHCVLGVLVLLIAIRLIDFATLAKIRQESPGEFALAVTTAVVVVAAGVEQGLVLAMILSLLRIVRHSYHPQTGVVTLNSDGSWKLSPVTLGTVTEPGLVMYRFGAALFYANASRFASEARCLTAQTPSPAQWFIVDAEAITHMDYSAAAVVRDLQRELRENGVEMGFARAPVELHADMDRHHVTEAVGPSRIFNRLHDALAAFEEAHRAKSLSIQ